MRPTFPFNCVIFFLRKERSEKEREREREGEGEEGREGRRENHVFSP